MSNRKYLRLADGYHDRSPYNPYQSSNKYSAKQPNSVSESRAERPSNINGGTGSRNSSPRARHSNLSPRSHRLKSSYSKTKELSKRGPSSSPVEVVSHHSSSSSDRMLKVNSISSDDIFPWSQHTSSSGKTYFYNCKTEKSQWEKPKEWIDRQKERERKKREAKEKGDYSREHLYTNHAILSKEKTRESASKRDSHGMVEGKSDSSRDRSSLHPDENRRMAQYYQGKSHVIKTTSANTYAVSTTTHRPDQLSARAESTVSPSNSLQDISPPVTPSTIPVQNSSSPLVGNSPIVTTRSPILLALQKSPILQTQSPAQPHLPAVPHHGSSTTPPPPPPPLPTQTSTMQNLHGVGIPVHNNESSYQSSPQINVMSTSSSKLTDNASFNGISVLSPSHLHPLQQATLLQAQFQSSSNVRPMTSGIVSSSPPHFQPIKQTNSAPGSPLSFNARLYPSNSPVQTSASQKPSVAYVTPQSINLQDFALHFNRGLISHTLGWPSEPIERQSQKLSDDILSLCSSNNRLKADLIPLNFHHNLTAMRKSVGAKRIEFLREQRKKLEASDWIS